VGEDLPGQVVVPRRQRDRDLPRGTPVELRRSSRARAAPTRQPPELRVQQSLLHQLVQVELRGVPGQVDALSGLVPAHRFRLGSDVEVERAARRLGERADPADL
jgi:hypothetical protein